MTTVHNDLRSTGQRRGVALLPLILGLVVGAASCGPTNQHDDRSRKEYDDKWRDASYAHIAGKITVPPEWREDYVEFFARFGQKHGFAITIDRDRPGPPGTLPSILMTRYDGVEVDADDFLVTRAGFGLRQPAPREAWKVVGEDLLRQLTAAFGKAVIIERGVWLPLGDNKLVAALWGASRELNLKSERLFAGTSQARPDELTQTVECMSRPCVLSYHFADDQLYRLRLTITDLAATDFPSIYDTVADHVRKLYGPTQDEVGPEAVAAGLGEAASLRWEINYMRVDWTWDAESELQKAILEYTDLDLLPKQ